MAFKSLLESESGFLNLAQDRRGDFPCLTVLDSKVKTIPFLPVNI